MALLVRMDIDKPYGRTGFVEKVKSRICEDYWLPLIPAFGYLRDLVEVLEFFNSKNVPSICFHRLCTTPSAKVVSLLQAGGHKFGMHAEDTRSYETFVEELSILKKMCPDLPMHSFTKHGSGQLKLGRRHYYPYEPEKYLEWGKQSQMPFHSGNGVAEMADFETEKEFYPKVFWMEPEYRSQTFNSVDQVLRLAEQKTVIISTHPENLRAIPQVKKDMITLIDEAHRRKIQFIV